jgi:Ca2+-binding EF-hand superfamily protein
MLLPLLFLVSAASAPKVPDNAPITVTGHAWAPFISPMGEPFRARTLSEDTLALWFVQADRNRDGAITLDEMQADADRFFARLDEDHNGEIEPEELIRYEWEIAPDIQVNSRVKRAPGEVAAKPRRSRPEDDDRPIVRAMDKGLQGGARYALLNIPEPVAAADTDFNRGITRAEFRAAATARFQLLDSSHHGRLTLPELRALRFALRGARSRKDEADTRYGSPLPRAN